MELFPLPVKTIATFHFVLLTVLSKNEAVIRNYVVHTNPNTELVDIIGVC